MTKINTLSNTRAPIKYHVTMGSQGVFDNKTYQQAFNRWIDQLKSVENDLSVTVGFYFDGLSSCVTRLIREGGSALTLSIADMFREENLDKDLFMSSLISALAESPRACIRITLSDDIYLNSAYVDRLIALMSSTEATRAIVFDQVPEHASKALKDHISQHQIRAVYSQVRHAQYRTTVPFKDLGLSVVSPELIAALEFAPSEVYLNLEGIMANEHTFQSVLDAVATGSQPLRVNLKDVAMDSAQKKQLFESLGTSKRSSLILNCEGVPITDDEITVLCNALKGMRVGQLTLYFLSTQISDLGYGKINEAFTFARSLITLKLRENRQSNAYQCVDNATYIQLYHGIATAFPNESIPEEQSSQRTKPFSRVVSTVFDYVVDPTRAPQENVLNDSFNKTIPLDLDDSFSDQQPDNAVVHELTGDMVAPAVATHSHHVLLKVFLSVVLITVVSILAAVYLPGGGVVGGLVALGWLSPSVTMPFAACVGLNMLLLGSLGTLAAGVTWCCLKALRSEAKGAVAIQPVHQNPESTHGLSSDEQLLPGVPLGVLSTSPVSQLELGYQS